MTKDYFKKTDYISNSQMWNFVKYNKYWERTLTPDIYKAFYIDKTMEFEINDAMIVGKIVDRYFDWEWEKVWEDYEAVSRRTWKSDKQEITKTMQTDALKMISWWNQWKKFKDFISLPDTKAQTELLKEYTITDENWEIHDIKIKWLPDFYNPKKKIIVDLKTSWSIDMVLEDLQFRWVPKFTARYIRQLAWYNFMLWGWYSWALALITTKWVKWIEVPNWILEKAWEQYEKDLVDLTKFIKNPESIKEDIFLSEEEVLKEEFTI